MDASIAAQPTTALIVAGGDPIDPAVVAHLPVAATVIAADGGMDRLRALGIALDVLVGDLDSVSAEALAEAEAAGVRIHRYPADKDATDLELALRHARDAGHGRVVLIGGTGGRLSHLLGNALVIAADEFADLRIDWHLGTTTVSVVRSAAPCELDGGPGHLVSLLPTGGSATGVTTAGLRWPLDAATLFHGSTRGVSNEMTRTRASVAVTGGTLLVVHERNPQP